MKQMFRIRRKEAQPLMRTKNAENIEAIEQLTKQKAVLERVIVE